MGYGAAAAAIVSAIMAGLSMAQADDTAKKNAAMAAVSKGPGYDSSGNYTPVAGSFSASTNLAGTKAQPSSGGAPGQRLNDVSLQAQNANVPAAPPSAPMQMLPGGMQGSMPAMRPQEQAVPGVGGFGPGSPGVPPPMTTGAMSGNTPPPMGSPPASGPMTMPPQRLNDVTGTGTSGGTSGGSSGGNSAAAGVLKDSQTAVQIGTQLMNLGLSMKPPPAVMRGILPAAGGTFAPTAGNFQIMPQQQQQPGSMFQQQRLRTMYG